MENIRKNYPALHNFTYLNSCSSGLFSDELLAYRRSMDEAFQMNGSNFRAGVYRKIGEVKNTLAATFGANPERMALISSCSLGINMALEALEGNLRVLHFENDYPSIVWPFGSRNFEPVTVENRYYTPEELIQLVKKHSVDVFAVSAVQYSNGNIIAPENFKAIKEACPSLLIMVDATQFWGVAPFNFDESGIDLFVASAFKWLCAGYGNGAMFMSAQLEKLLHSRVRGYNTYKKPVMEGQPTLGEYFEPGHQDLLAFKSLQFQVEQLAEIGFEAIQAQIKKLKAHARKRITEETNFDINTSLNPRMESGILSVNAPKELVKFFRGHKLVCSFREGLRLGIHFYNNLNDIDQLVEGLKMFERNASKTLISNDVE